ncbi:MAG: hypothetical protein L6R48_16040 [Planctomycetes bacterium]|nr:hypothetical protein [Planctomycetota bacterium]
MDAYALESSSSVPAERVVAGSLAPQPEVVDEARLVVWVRQARTWLQAARLAGGLLVALLAVHAGLILLRGPDRFALPAPVWPGGTVQALVLALEIATAVAVVGLCRWLLLLQRACHPRPLRTPYWQLVALALVPGVNLLVWSRVLRSIFDGAPLRAIAAGPLSVLGILTWTTLGTLLLSTIGLLIADGPGVIQYIAWACGLAGRISEPALVAFLLVVLDQHVGLLGALLDDGSSTEGQA